MSEFIHTPKEIAEEVNGKQNGPAREDPENPEYFRSPEQEPTAVLRFSQTSLMEALKKPASEDSSAVFEEIIAINSSPTVQTAVRKLQNTRLPDKMLVLHPNPAEGEPMIEFVPHDQAFDEDEVIDTPTQVTLPAARFFEDLTTKIEEELLLKSGNAENLLDEEEKAEFLKASQQALAGHDLRIHTGDNPWKDSYKERLSLELPDKSLADMTPEEKAAEGYQNWQQMVGEKKDFILQPSTTIESISLD